MSIFQFSKSQRVTVPSAMAGADNVQGIVAEGHAELGAEPRYIMQWPNAEKFGDGGLFVMIVGEVGQAELIKAQPPEMVTLEECNRRCGRTYDDGYNIAMIEVEKAREARLAKRKAARKAAARKRSRK